MPLAYHSYPDSAPDSRTPGTIERVASLADRDLQEILDAVPDAMVVVDQAGRIRLANRQAEVVFGYKRQELTGERVEVLVPEHLVGDHAGQRSHFFEQPQARPMGARPDLKARRRDGSVFPVEINLSPLTSDEGMLVVASIRDISERRRIDAEQRWQAEFSSGIINSLPGIFYLVDKSGHMRQWNANLETVTGYSADELSGMTAWEILDPSEHQKAREAISTVFDSGEALLKALLPIKDGSLRSYHFQGRRIILGGEEFIAGLGIDMTEVQRTEAALDYLSGLQRTLVDASRRFIDLGSANLDDVITDVLARVGSYCEVDRSYLFRFREARTLMDNTHEWCAPAIQPQIDNLQNIPISAVPKVVQTMEQRDIMHVPRVADLPSDWDKDRAMFESEDVQSLVVVPIEFSGELHGFVGFDSVRRERVWGEEEVGLLEVLADLLGAVIQREHSARALRESEAATAESEAKYRSVVDNIREVVFQADAEGRWTFLNPAWEEITGFRVDESLGQRCLEFVHPQDRAGSEREFRQLMAGRQSLAQSEARYLSRQGDFRWFEVNVRPTCDEDGRIVGTAGTLRDITEQREAERKMRYLAHYDSVTGLPNRILALDRLDQWLKASGRADEQVAVLFLDLDHFKKANDTLGHEAGDQLLREAAQRLLADVRDDDTVARFGGDEFLIVAGGLEDGAAAQPVAEKLLKSFRDPFQIEGREFMLTASLGIAIAPDDGTTSQELLRNADIAMYRSKGKGRNTCCYFTPAMNHDVERRQSVEEQLRGALARDELPLVYQPIVDLHNGAVVGAEALLRWNNPVLGQVSPDEFIPIAEQSGQIDAIGRQVLEQALERAARWRTQRDPDFWVSVNVSPRQFRDPCLVAGVQEALDSNGLPGRALYVEITESVLLDERGQAGVALAELKKLGVGIAMDDFGTGYASLRYLRHFPFDTLKIDRSFVGDITADPEDAELVIASLSLAHSLNLQALAEGVESRAQLDLLRQHGCELAQGYLFARPLSASDLSDFPARIALDRCCDN